MTGGLVSSHPSGCPKPSPTDSNGVAMGSKEDSDVEGKEPCSGLLGLTSKSSWWDTKQAWSLLPLRGSGSDFPFLP